MTNHGAVAISSSIVVLAAVLLVGLGMHTSRGDGELAAGVGALLGILSLISWVASLVAMQRQRTP